MQVNIHEAKTHLSRLLNRVAVGEEVTIARAGVPVARLVGVKRRRIPRPMGMYRGQFKVPEDFDAPLSKDVLALFEGEEPKRPNRIGKKNRRRRPA
ncbi:MAG TPA: type II toxin-antitoxin system Phd/YefM family antitoxin [Terriglobia bacterium]|nr:type II toxin-antitoxin system Phd/YefM family antitoxin [Terriglobia bacterium]